VKRRLRTRHLFLDQVSYCGAIFFQNTHGKKMSVDQFEQISLQEHLKIVRILTIIVAGIADVNNAAK